MYPKMLMSFLVSIIKYDYLLLNFRKNSSNSDMKININKSENLKGSSMCKKNNELNDKIGKHFIRLFISKHTMATLFLFQ